MKSRQLGKTGISVSEIGLGTWQVGGRWGTGFNEPKAQEILEAAIEQGITFFDTADVYEGGKSESAVGALKRKYGSNITMATKCGRRFQPHTTETFSVNGIVQFIEDSLRNTGLEQLDLIQLHCPPTDIYYMPEYFAALEKLQEAGKVGHVGVSVEKVEEALKAIEYPIVSTVQIIVNMFRQRPTELFFREAQKKNIGIIARVPLASGLLTGTITKNTTFAKDDHRFFNRSGAAFDRGETFSGVPLEQGIAAVEILQQRLTSNYNMPLLALRWILMFDAVSTVIPGASRPEQITSNCEASDVPPLSDTEMNVVQEVYKEYIAPYVHQQW
ncbi:aldo/keto reductase [Spirochaeta lutea]|uniref:Aldo/keto reductase n=1 Tax=Spirochaeta lutea TaxID=1480694 RepID=A0A098R0L2_9SPIO|nr:aldo/keto reductase [Spirochaeta lutea]KGE73700.1 aldo/keto reductase [Spirochaeta lutea]